MRSQYSARIARADCEVAVRGSRVHQVDGTNERFASKANGPVSYTTDYLGEDKRASATGRVGLACSQD